MFDRETLLSSLRIYIPFDDHEKKMVDKVAALIESTGNCFHNNCFPSHITASAWIIDCDSTVSVSAIPSFQSKI